jgi:hypothetical protein
MEILEDDDRVWFKVSKEELKNPEELMKKAKPIADKKWEEKYGKGEKNGRSKYSK